MYELKSSSYHQKTVAEPSVAAGRFGFQTVAVLVAAVREPYGDIVQRGPVRGCGVILGKEIYWIMQVSL